MAGENCVWWSARPWVLWPALIFFWDFPQKRIIVANFVQRKHQGRIWPTVILWTPNLLKNLAHTWLVVQILATKRLPSSGSPPKNVTKQDKKVSPILDPPKIMWQNRMNNLTNSGSPQNNVTKQDEKVSPILDPPLPSDSLLPTEREETRLPSILKKSKTLLCLDFLWKLLLEGTESNSILQLPTPSTSSSILCFGSGFCFGFSLHFGFWTCSLPVLKPLQLLGSLWKSMVRWSLLVLFGSWWSSQDAGLCRTSGGSVRTKCDGREAPLAAARQ